MSTKYIEILSVQRPFPFTVDDNNRTLFSVNFVAIAAAPVDNFVKEMVRLISNAGLGTFYDGVTGNVFIGPESVIPGDLVTGPFITIIDTGGMDPLENQTGEKYERLSFQLIVRDTSPVSAETRALAIWRTLDGQRNVTVAA